MELKIDAGYQLPHANKSTHLNKTFVGSTSALLKALFFQELLYRLSAQRDRIGLTDCERTKTDRIADLRWKYSILV
jgi:hypothetical protein